MVTAPTRRKIREAAIDAISPGADLGVDDEEQDAREQQRQPIKKLTVSKRANKAGIRPKTVTCFASEPPFSFLIGLSEQSDSQHVSSLTLSLSVGISFAYPVYPPAIHPTVSYSISGVSSLGAYFPANCFAFASAGAMTFVCRSPSKSLRSVYSCASGTQWYFLGKSTNMPHGCCGRTMMGWTGTAKSGTRPATPAGCS